MLSGIMLSEEFFNVVGVNVFLVYFTTESLANVTHN